MNEKKFKWTSGLLGFFFSLIGWTMFLAVIVSITNYFFGIFEESFVVEAVPEQVEGVVSASPRLTEISRFVDYLIIAPIYSALVGYSSLQGGILFEKLSEEHSPFSLDFTKMLKRISAFLIIADFIAPLVYTLVLNFSPETGSHFFIDLTYLTLIGLMLYVFSVILDYGISLQEFSDQVV